MATIYGTDERDVLTGTNTEDVIYGRDGDDTLRGLASFDTLYGDFGNDTLRGGSGDDYLIGGAGNDILDGGTSLDADVPPWWWFEEDTANYSLYMPTDGGVTVNLRTGVASDGLGGTDTLIDIEAVIGSDHDDTLIGGNPDNDSWEFFNGAGGDDVIDGGSGYDVSYYGEMRSYDDARGIRADLKAGTIRDQWGDFDTVSNVEAVWATDYDDVLRGSDGDDTFYPRLGGDLIAGRAGSDTVSYHYDKYGGQPQHGIDADLRRGTVFDLRYETDTLSSIENVTGSRLDDTIRGDNKANVLDGDFGDDYVSGRDGADTLRGYYGQDALNGGAGRDVLDGGAGLDTLRGGSAGDTFVFNPGCDEDHILDFRKEAGDKIDVSGFGFDSVDDVLSHLQHIGPDAYMLQLSQEDLVIFDYARSAVPLDASNIIL